jgi:hypothetical protein
VEASDDGSIGVVELYANGDLLAQLTTAPYDYVWTDAALGSYTLTAVAIDDQLNESTSQSVTIAVCDDADGDGICDEVLPPPPPPPVDQPIVLAVDELNSDEYGNSYGPGPDRDFLYLEFDTTATTLSFSVTGFDIGAQEPVLVILNGIEIGQLSQSGFGELNAGDSFVLDPALLNSGLNRIEIRQTREGRRWGVTNLLVSTG